MAEKSIADSIQAILEKNGGFMNIKRLPNSMSAELRQELGIRSNENKKVIQYRIENSTGEKFVFHAKGNSLYVLIPCEPSELVLGLLSEKKAFDTRVIQGLPFTIAEFAEIVSGLAEEGRVIVKLNGNLKPKIYKAPKVMKAVAAASVSANDSGEYTPERFREAFENSDKGRTFVRIFKVRRYLGWPRDVFDNMVMKLLKEGKIFVHPAEPTVLKPDEYEDSFRDEFGDMNGTVTWND